MALISPGVEVTVIDESQYTPTAAGTVAYVLLATAQDKATPQGTAALGTSALAANRITTVTSQRELISLFGSPNFEIDAAGNPVNGSEINEYGLLAAYSALGVSNQIYVQRANVDLNQLDGTSIRPTGLAADGTYWLDVATTSWGIFEWDSTGFLQQIPVVITDTALLSSGVPLSSFGAIGTYAVVATSTSNPVYYKGWNNDWVLVGSDAWLNATPVITGVIANPANLAIGQKLVVNGVNVTLTGTTVSSAASDIDGVTTGVTARVNSDGYLEIFVDSSAASSGNLSLPNGLLSIQSGATIGATDAAVRLGLLQTDIATVVGNVYTYNSPTVTFDTFRNTPAWRASDVTPRPYGSVWFKTSAAGQGANWAVKRYDGIINQWVLQTAPLYSTDDAAVYGLDPVGGGAGIAVGTVYVKYDTLGTTTGSFKPYVKDVTGILKVTGPTPSVPLVFTAGDEFELEISVPGTDALTSATITLSGTTAASFVGDILAANLLNIVAAVETTGAVSISHLAGGTITLRAISGTPLTTAGWTTSTRVQQITAGVEWIASPFTALTYTYSDTAPYSNPADGTLWYYNNALEVDIMINDGSGWKGYQSTLTGNGLDARGYDLGNTDPDGPILSSSQPTLQSDGSQLVAGDLWIDTSDLENYPVISRYDGSVWELIDNTDQISIDGIVFADARWAPNDSTNPVTDDLPTIASLLSNDYVDDDAPDYRLYPRGSLLFNTRRSGFNVKRFESNWHSTAVSPPTELGAWVSTSGVDSDGVPYFGHWAQRNTVVEAMKAAVTSSVTLREEQQQFNLICCPGYPELIQDMITLNNDRLQTAFVIGDSPLSLDSSSTTLDNWAKNNNLATTNGLDGLVSTSEYLGVYYPSGLATNLDGNTVVVPPSHMMLRTFIRSDNVSYPWFAPAGVRRGLIDNVSSIGYIDITAGNTFRSIGVTNGLRDILYTNNVNPITVLPGVGLVAYGQKTRAAQTSAMDRINVARLTCYLRTVLAKVAAPFIFEPNDTITRSQVQKAFESVLNDVVAKRGIYDYLVVCDTSNNTPDRIDRNELYVDIAIQPVKAIEFIYIPVRLRNTGASLTTV
jgi:hypothetical protein